MTTLTRTQYFIAENGHDEEALFTGTGPDDDRCQEVVTRRELERLGPDLWAAVTQLAVLPEPPADAKAPHRGRPGPVQRPGAGRVPRPARPGPDLQPLAHRQRRPRAGRAVARHRQRLTSPRGHRDDRHPARPDRDHCPAASGTPVLDSAENAWAECGSANLGDFGDLHAHEIEQAARVLMQQALIEAWARRKRLVLLVDQSTFLSTPDIPGEPARAEYQAVWQEAADSIDLDALLSATDLAHEYTAHYQD